MISEQEKKELIRKRNDLNKEINTLRKGLNDFNTKKESDFENKEKITKSISQLIGQVKSSKSARNKFTKQVKKVKEIRTHDNEEIKKKVKEIKELNKKKKEIQLKHNIKGNPSFIKKDIDKLEFKLETEAMGFDKEKKLMKTINGLRKQYKEVKVVSDVFEKIHKLDKELKELRKKAQDEHKEVQKTAEESQHKHEEVIETSKEIDDLKEKEEDAYKNFFDSKKKFTEINDKLQEKLKEIGKLNEKLREFGADQKHRKEEFNKKSLKQKAALVNEKMKKGGKLTTEDLLVLQGLDK